LGVKIKSNKMSIKNSELILNSDGSIYHLGLKPLDISNNYFCRRSRTELGKLQNILNALILKVKVENSKHKQEPIKENDYL